MSKFKAGDVIYSKVNGELLLIVNHSTLLDKYYLVFLNSREEVVYDSARVAHSAYKYSEMATQLGGYELLCNLSDITREWKKDNVSI